MNRRAAYPNSQVLQLWNTYMQHESTFKMPRGFKKDDRDNVAIRNAARAETNMNKNVDGSFTDEDLNALKILSNVMAEMGEPVTVAVGAPKRKTPVKAGA